ncbi:hypothetical protein GAO09_06180 [Rhizobiales bacterium RZME27]|uniref:Uncharacterized protein n=1 Tax=Endobacterium cereale TaxID=2663029 RepID=A0A6A8A703_9HYPH|nr:hypothetical protein [Endobacterium cereale]MEB2846211.1 hypothetical protein [Endobacterium cereale]MQY45648.1 hypothetical protein [Endobacterium cereale]
MGQRIIGLVGKRTALNETIKIVGAQYLAPLQQDLFILPLGHSALDALATYEKPSHTGFTYLGPELEQALRNASAKDGFLYIESDFFGGIGSQAAALFRDARLIWKEARALGEEPALFSQLLGCEAKWPVNEGLRAMGVQRRSDMDEFSAIGLHEYRAPDMEDE